VSQWRLSCNSAIGFLGGSASVRLVLQGIRDPVGQLEAPIHFLPEQRTPSVAQGLTDAAPVVSTELVGGESHGLILPEAGADSGTHWRPLVRLLEHDRTPKGLNAEG
jgi:hypothetical protein